MSGAFRSLIQQKIAANLSNENLSKLTEIASNILVKRNGKTNDDKVTFTFSLPLQTREYDIEHTVKNLTINHNDIFEKINLEISGSRSYIDFSVPRNVFVKEILQRNVRGLLPPQFVTKKQKVVVEFSSPNIAKPFHVGHLRSTIIGSFVANIHSFVENDVTKINYLGDWGTAYGYVQLGVDSSNVSEEAMKENPIYELYKAYVRANKLAESDPKIADRARRIFENLEKGATEDSLKWQHFRRYTTDELEKTYERIGVTFDEYNWESSYRSQEIQDVIEQINRMGILNTDEEQRKVIAVNETRSVPIIKSDGTTLYLTRDIAAAIDRFKKYNFDRMYYVVDSAQTDHFNNLFAILQKMQMPCADRLSHVKFGKIRGMSTRKGTAVFLRDFLDEARDFMREKQRQSSTTKVSLDLDDKSSDSLGIAAVIIHDLKQKRQRDYDFDWNVALDIKGETGVKLQYAHCRLINLEKNSRVPLPTECDPSLLSEPIVDALITKIAQFDEIILSSYRSLEPCYLAKYLFELSHILNKTLRELYVQNEAEDVASQRLLLYRVTRNILAQGMILLGLKPLETM